MKAEETIQHESDADNTMVTDLRGQVERYWIDQNVSVSETRIVTEVVELTPTLATELLRRNPHNRKIAMATVQRYASDIESGLFDGLNGETIKVSRDGYLNDGQHRCRAVQMAGRSIQVLMVFGVERESRKTLDQGFQRDVSHHLGMDGVKNAALVGTVAKHVWMVLAYRKLRGGEQVPSKMTRLQWLNEGNLEEVGFCAQRCNTTRARHIASPSLVATTYFCIRRVDPRDAEYFIESLIEGAGLESRNPILAARERLIQARMTSKDPRYRLNSNDTLNAMFKAWNYYRDGRKVYKITPIRLSKGQKLPILR